MAGRLPDGAMVWRAGVSCLVSNHALLPWSMHGYGSPVAVQPGTPLELLTPPSVVAALAAGYLPLVHPSAAPTAMRVLPARQA